MSDEYKNPADDITITIVELAQQSGFSDEWIESEIIDTVGVFGVILIDENPGSTHVNFNTYDDQSEIQVTVRRLPKQKLH